jgi:ketosteroid isomerase-like protein
MASSNLDLIRSIYTFVERGELNLSKWADPGVEWVTADGPEPGVHVGVERMEEGLSDYLDAWVDYRVTVDEYRQLDEERILVLTHRSGRGKASELELEQMWTKGATLYHIRDGRLTRVVDYLDRDRALADLGLEE